jgi:hypothetical protein
MTIRTWLALAAFTTTTCFAGEPRQLDLRWNELGNRLGRSKVALVLPDATRVKGRVHGVEAEGLRLKTSKGETLIPRKSVKFLRVIEYRSIGRLACTVGAIAAAAAITVAGSQDIYEGSLLIIVPAVGAAGTVGAGVGGYYLGKALDKKVTEIRVIP